ncbi:hypothetical protein PIROE2DRAFT_7419 [Piromyces sp. E2]|nr:hypothetical protein PIROE2DRAFT_7419 [Piromyces sp. E2]|eukprot:OUM65577.1 hypothetical protein PIROE2DRAFT_7419 [Piromyces sp. E2]
MQLLNYSKEEDIQVDVWSLGVILYVMTTGCLPFNGKNLQEVRESVCRGKYRIPFYITDRMYLILKCYFFSKFFIVINN